MVNLLEIGRVLARRGKTVTVRQNLPAVASDGGTVSMASSDTIVKAIVRSFKQAEVKGLVEAGDREIVLSAAALSFTPFPLRDQLVIDGKPASILTVATTFDAGLPVVHRIHARG